MAGVSLDREHVAIINRSTVMVGLLDDETGTNWTLIYIAAPTSTFPL